MKAKHRHELKTNELAEWIASLPQWANENLTTIIIVAAAVVLAGGVILYLGYQKKVVSTRERLNLTMLVSRLSRDKNRILRAYSQGADVSSTLLELAGQLEAFARGSRNDEFAAFALIKRAEALRAELHYRPTTVSGRDRIEQIRLAQKSYNEAIERLRGGRSKDVHQQPGADKNMSGSTETGAKEKWENELLAGVARFGLGLCEEELGDYKTAKQIYQSLATNPVFEPIGAAAAARQRLEFMDEYKEKVVFRRPTKPAPPMQQDFGPKLPVTEPVTGQNTTEPKPAPQPQVNVPAGTSAVEETAGSKETGKGHPLVLPAGEGEKALGPNETTTP